MTAITESIDRLQKQFNNRVRLVEKRPGILQLVAPFYHDDGDMFEIYIEDSPRGDGFTRISDHGMTMMRLSYSFELDTPNKEKIFQRIIAENNIEVMDGRLSLDVEASKLYAGILSFSKAVANVSNMRLYRREVVRSLFYENLNEFITTNLAGLRVLSARLRKPVRRTGEGRWHCAYRMGLAQMVHPADSLVETR